MSRRLVFGLTGYPKTGKTTVANYLEQTHGFKTFEGSSLIKAHAANEGITLSKREDYGLHHKRMQQLLGATCLTDVMLLDPAERVLQTGLRAKLNFECIKRANGLVIALASPVKLCVERTDFSDPKNAKSEDEYVAAMKFEESQTGSGLQTSWCIENADHVLDTSKPLQETFAELDEIVVAHVAAT